MSQINEQKIAKCRNFIQELNEVQGFYYDALISELDIDEGADGFLFDYIFNHNEEEYSSFSDYMKQFPNT